MWFVCGMESADGRRRNKPRIEDVKVSVNCCYAGMIVEYSVRLLDRRKAVLEEDSGGVETLPPFVLWIGLLPLLEIVFVSVVYRTQLLLRAQSFW